MDAGSVFVYRDHCVVGDSTEKDELLSRPFTDPAVWRFLEIYYERRIQPEILSAAHYQIVKCSRCAFIWQASILNDHWMAELYDMWIGAADSLQKRQIAGIERYTVQMSAITALFPSKATHEIRVLDFGMGWGFWCMAAQAHGFQVVGLEVSEKRLRFAREQGIESWNALPDHSPLKFNFINAEQVFEHIPHPRNALMNLAAHLTPSGVIRIAVPDGSGIERKLAQPDWQASKDALHPLEHINCFTRKTLTALGLAAGLQVIHPPLQVSLCLSFRSVAGNLYRRFWGTAVYFRKPHV